MRRLDEILTEHESYVESDGDRGTRADFTDQGLADLSRAATARVVRAIATGASGAKVVTPLQGGATVFLVRCADGPRVQAGCRSFTARRALEHWGGGRVDRGALVGMLNLLLEDARREEWPNCPGPLQVKRSARPVELPVSEQMRRHARDAAAAPALAALVGAQGREGMDVLVEHMAALYACAFEAGWRAQERA